MSTREMMRTVALSVLLGLCGCCQARLVRSDSYGGVVAIPDNSNTWPTYNRKNAEELMMQKCPQGYRIEEESEFVTGQLRSTHTEGNQHSVAYQVLGVGNVDTTEDVRDLTEWRIRFRAKDAPPVAQTTSAPPAELQMIPLSPLPDQESQGGETAKQSVPVSLSPELPPTPVPVPVTDRR
jgi:hypothetical protein